MEKTLATENDPTASPAMILACIQLAVLLVRLAIALYSAYPTDVGRIMAAELLSKTRSDPGLTAESWYSRVSYEDRAIWNDRGPRWRAIRILEAIGQEAEE